MATRSAIAVTHGTVVKGVYCHWDGYIDHNGVILQEHYDSAKANHLVALGDVSSLQPEIGEKHAFSQIGSGLTQEEYESRYGNMTTFYGRDREEVDTSWKVFADADEFMAYFDGCGCEYFYLMHEGVWYVNQYGRGWERLDKVIVGESVLQDA